MPTSLLQLADWVSWQVSDARQDHVPVHHRVLVAKADDVELPALLNQHLQILDLVPHRYFAAGSLRAQKLPSLLGQDPAALSGDVQDASALGDLEGTDGRVGVVDSLDDPGVDAVRPTDRFLAGHATRQDHRTLGRVELSAQLAEPGPDSHLLRVRLLVGTSRVHVVVRFRTSQGSRIFGLV